MSPPQLSKTHYIHRISYSTQEKLVGAFVLLAMGVFFVLLLINARELDWFDDHLELNVFFRTAEGVSRDTPVRISGIQVGRVVDFEITPEHTFAIRIRISERYSGLVRTDSVASLSRLAVLGRTTIEISAGSPEKLRLESGATLPVKESLSIDELVAQAMPVMEGLEGIIQSVAEITASIGHEQVQGIFGRIEEILVDVEKMTKEINEAKGLAGALIYDESFLAEVNKTNVLLQSTLLESEGRLKELEPILEHLDAISVQASESFVHLPNLLESSGKVVDEVNITFSTLNQEMTKVPELLQRTNMLMQQTDELLNEVRTIWPLSRGRNEDLPQLLEADPHE